MVRRHRSVDPEPQLRHGCKDRASLNAASKLWRERCEQVASGSWVLEIAVSHCEWHHCGSLGKGLTRTKTRAPSAECTQISVTHPSWRRHTPLVTPEIHMRALVLNPGQWNQSSHQKSLQSFQLGLSYLRSLAFPQRLE